MNRYNDLYDPLQARSVCISGQLYLLELAEHLYQAIDGLKVVALNTDGIVCEMEDDQYDAYMEIVREWEQRTGFELEEDRIVKLVSRDINSYIEVLEGGEVKCKGGVLVRGESAAGAWKVNNNAIAVAEAVKKYFLDGVVPEESIGADDDISHYQMIVKSGAMYRESYQEVDGEKVPVQRVNRVYATKDERYGKLYKVKVMDDGEDHTAKHSSLPDHCRIDNENTMTIDEVDKDYYIAWAWKEIDAFKGVSKKGRKTMATKDVTKMNVYQKLAEARVRFLDQHIEKSGKNMHLAFKYYKLDDIVPPVTRIFHELGLLSVFEMDHEQASLVVFNTENSDECITFHMPIEKIPPIENRDGKQTSNPMQMLGSVHTYARRYMLLAALDISEPDQFDAEVGQPVEKSESKVPLKANIQPAKSAPVSNEKREEIKQEAVAVDDAADALQVKAIKNALKKLAEENETVGKQMLTKVAVETEKFTKVSRKRAEELIIEIGKAVEAAHESKAD